MSKAQISYFIFLMIIYYPALFLKLSVNPIDLHIITLYHLLMTMLSIYFQLSIVNLYLRV